ncbi:thiol-disulfide oxidoreductase [Bacteroidales bacterium Barb7]|nr:thiol-disulfide oxidoreductase [Bacteroidales bacterium Barb7]
MNLDERINVQEVSYLDIALPNVKGEIIRLSDVAEGKVVLINFTAYQTEWSASLNIELRELYARYHEKGLEIYQASLDSDLHFWSNSAVNIPWITVIDPESVYSQSAALYAVKQLPALFLLDRKSNMVKRIEKIEHLEADIKPYI